MVISPRSHSNRHFHVAQVQLQHLCHRYFNSHSSQLQLQGNTSKPSQRHRCLKPGHPTRSTEPSGKQRTAAAVQRPADFLHSPTTGQTFKTTYVHLDTNKALQPSISCLSYRRRKPIQHIRTFKLLQKSSVCDELPTD